MQAIKNTAVRRNFTAVAGQILLTQLTMMFGCFFRNQVLYVLVQQFSLAVTKNIAGLWVNLDDTSGFVGDHKPFRNHRK